MTSFRVERDSVSDRWPRSDPKRPIGCSPDSSEAECGGHVMGGDCRRWIATLVLPKQLMARL